MFNLPWYSYLPVIAGIVGGIIGGMAGVYHYKKSNRDKKK